MAWKLYDYRVPNKPNDIAEWTRSLGKQQIAKLNAKLDMLERYGPELPPGLLADLGSGLYKLKVHGHVQLRPHLCAGPFDKRNEFTILIGAVEKDFKLIPANAGQIAIARMEEILRDPSRRVIHERVVPRLEK